MRSSAVSTNVAAWKVSARAAATSASIWASLNWMPWRARIGLPNALARSAETSRGGDQHVLEREVDRALREPAPLLRDGGARAVERHHRDLEAVALAAEHVLGRDLDVLEARRAELPPGHAHRAQPVDADPRRLAVDD